MTDDQRITPGEALFGFMGWLTSLNQPVTLSADHDASIGADLVAEYLVANDLEMPRQGIYPNNLRKPDTRSMTEIDAEFISRFD